MRGTLHFVPAADVHWMLRLLTPRVIAGMAKRQQSLGLSTSDLVRSERLFLDALRGGKQLTREAMYALLDDAGIASVPQRSYHFLCRLAMEGLLCFGSHQGKQPTFALLDEWCPETRTWDRDESLAELAKRYFCSHGPATLDDYVRWSGLTVGEARAGLSMASSVLSRETLDGTVYWMPQRPTFNDVAPPSAFLLTGFDEYMLGYKDRSAALALEHANAICPGSNGIFIPTIVVGGQVVGTWSKTVKKAHVEARLSPFRALTDLELAAVSLSAEAYGAYLGKAVRLVD